MHRLGIRSTASRRTNTEPAKPPVGKRVESDLIIVTSPEACVYKIKAQEEAISALDRGKQQMCFNPSRPVQMSWLWQIRATVVLTGWRLSDGSCLIKLGVIELGSSRTTRATRAGDFKNQISKHAISKLDQICSENIRNWARISLFFTRPRKSTKTSGS